MQTQTHAPLSTRQFGKLNKQRLCLYDLEWQALRVSLLGKWTNNRDVARNTDALSTYLYGDGSFLHKAMNGFKALDLLASRQYRVLNLLNAVRMGYHGMMYVNSEIDDMVVDIRDMVQDQYNHNTQDNPRAVDWEAPTPTSFRDDLKFVSGDTARAILKDLQSRYTMAIYRAGSTTRAAAAQKVSVDRPELCWAIDQLTGNIITLGS